MTHNRDRCNRHSHRGRSNPPGFSGQDRRSTQVWQAPSQLISGYDRELWRLVRDRRGRRLRVREDNGRQANRRQPRARARDRCSITTATIAIATICGSRNAPRSTTTIPNSLETDLLVRHVQELKSGRPIDVPQYDFTRHARLVGDRDLSAAPRADRRRDSGVHRCGAARSDGHQSVCRHRLGHPIHPPAAARRRRARPHDGIGDRSVPEHRASRCTSSLSSRASGTRT